MGKLNLEQTLDMFQNGEQRYDKDGYFREAITALQAGIGVHAVLDRVLKEHVILMRLHSESLDKNRVAVAEVQRLSDELGKPKILTTAETYPGELTTLRAQIVQVREENQRLSDEVASYKDALQHYQK